MHFRVTCGTEGDQVLLGIVSGLASVPFMVILEKSCRRGVLPAIACVRRLWCMGFILTLTSHICSGGTRFARLAGSTALKILDWPVGNELVHWYPVRILRVVALDPHATRSQRGSVH